MTEDNRLLLHFNNLSSSTNDISLPRSLSTDYSPIIPYDIVKPFSFPSLSSWEGNVGNSGLYRLSLRWANFHHPSDPSILVCRQLHYLVTFPFSSAIHYLHPNSSSFMPICNPVTVIPISYNKSLINKIVWNSVSQPPGRGPRSAVRYRALASIMPGRERFSWNW